MVSGLDRRLPRGAGGRHEPAGHSGAGAAHGPRGAASRVRARAGAGARREARPSQQSLKSTPRASRAAAPEGGREAGSERGRAELAAAGRLVWECHFLSSESQGLSQAPAVSSGALLPLFLPRCAGAGGNGEGARGRGDSPGGCSGSSALGPLSCLQTASLKRKASILSPLPALTPSLFSCLTNPRIIQLRKRWKEVS